MKTMVIYDSTGHIISQTQGIGIYTPVGIPYLEVELGLHEYVESVDVNVSPNVAVIVNMPKSETEITAERITLAENAINMLMDMM